jgi:hypothetical protein
MAPRAGGAVDRVPSHRRRRAARVRGDRVPFENRLLPASDAQPPRTHAHARGGSGQRAGLEACERKQRESMRGTVGGRVWGTVGRGGAAGRPGGVRTPLRPPRRARRAPRAAPAPRPQRRAPRGGALQQAAGRRRVEGADPGGGGGAGGEGEIRGEARDALVAQEHRALRAHRRERPPRVRPPQHGRDECPALARQARL